MRLAPRTTFRLAIATGSLLAVGCASADEPALTAPEAPTTQDAPGEDDGVTDVERDDDLTVTEDEADGGTDDRGEAVATVAIAENGSDFSFSPAEVTVEVGDRVRFVHEGAAAHTVSGGGLNSGQLEAGDEYLVRFEEAGEVSYFCYLHPEMTGIVTVG